MAKPARKRTVVRLTDAKTRTRVVRSEVDATTKKLAALRAEYAVMPLEKLLGPAGEEVEKEMGRLDEVLADSNRRLFRLTHGLPEVEKAEQPAPRSEATARSLPLPFDFGWEPAGDENVEELEDLAAIREFFTSARSVAKHASALAPGQVAYTYERHLMLDVSLAVLRRFVRAGRQRSDALEARLEVLEGHTDNILSRGLFFSGSYQKSLGYEKGSFVSHQGSGWAAITDVEVGEVPGESSGWQLAVKRGRDGRDAPGANP